MSRKPVGSFIRLVQAWLVVVGLACLSPSASCHFLEDQIFVVDRASNSVYFVNRVNWTWSRAITPASGLGRASALCFNGQGLLLVADQQFEQVMEFQPTLKGATVLDRQDGVRAPGSANAMAVDGEGWIYLLSPGRRTLLKASRDYRYSWILADAQDGLRDPSSVAVRADGTLLVADGSTGRLLAFDAQGNGSVFDQIPGEAVRSLAIGGNRDLFVACDSGNLYEYPGGVVSSRTLVGTYGGAGPSIQFDFDYQFLIHVNRGDGFLRTIDAGTGAGVIRVQAGWDPVSVAVMGSQGPPASFTAFGPWVTGAGGYVPEIAGSGSPRPGGNVVLHLHGFVGGAAALLVTGIDKARVPVYGGYLLVDLAKWHSLSPLLLWGRPGRPGEGIAWRGFAVPPDPALSLGRVVVQAMAADPLALQGVSMSGGLMVWLGD